MKRDSFFIGAMAVFGVLSGLFVTAILMAIAAPQFCNYPLTVAEKADWARMERASRYVMGPASPVLYTAFLASAIFIIVLFLAAINPHTKSVFKNWRSVAGAKLLVVFLLTLALICILVFESGTLFSMEQRFSTGIQFAIYAVCIILIWFVAGEEGWAGDFSSWGLGKEARPTRVVLLGLAAGTMTFTVYHLFNFSWRKYFILVSEVLDRSGETSFLGYKLLALGNVIGFGLELPLIAAFIIAFAPVRREHSEIRRRLSYPVVGLLLILILLSACYNYAGNKYDLDKTSLAQVLGVPDKAKDSRTIVVFLPSKDLPVTVQEWPQEVTGWGLGLQTTIGLSKENLQKVETYLDSHPEGSVFTYAGRDVLMKGYYALWDVDNGLAWQVKAAESQILSRLVLLARFPAMQMRDENLKLLASFSDENRWYPGGRSALMFSKAYKHFGKTEEAKRWLQKAKDQGVEITDEKFMKDPVVTNGIIRGKIYLNAKPLQSVKVALLGYPTNKNQLEDSYKLMDLTLARQLLDVKLTGKDGGFAFSSLGSGKYLIAIMTDKDVVPFDAKKGTITARNVPGLVAIGPKDSQDLGTISIERR